MLSILANPETRRIAAEMLLGSTLEQATTTLAPAKRTRVTAGLVRSGLITADTHAFNPEIFRPILEEATAPRQTGIERFLDGTRIRQYPANLDERHELLTRVVHNAFRPGGDPRGT